jgi:hypothetical protein
MRHARTEFTQLDRTRASRVRAHRVRIPIGGDALYIGARLYD